MLNIDMIQTCSRLGEIYTLWGDAHIPHSMPETHFPCPPTQKHKYAVIV